LNALVRAIRQVEGATLWLTLPPATRYARCPQPAKKLKKKK